MKSSAFYRFGAWHIEMSWNIIICVFLRIWHCSSWISRNCRVGSHIGVLNWDGVCCSPCLISNWFLLASCATSHIYCFILYLTILDSCINMLINSTLHPIENH